MTPTAKLRFLEKEIWMPFEGRQDVHVKQVTRILQQWWEKDSADRYTAAIVGDTGGEWRDVPLEEEQA